MQNFREHFLSLGRLTRYSSVATGILIFYGYFCRLAGIYFFWESKTIGWTLLFLALIFYLHDRIELNKQKQKKSIGEKICYGIIVFILVIRGIMLLAIPSSDAFAAAKIQLGKNKSIISETGEIKSYSVMPTGSLQVHIENGKTSGSAALCITLKGEKKFKDVTVYLTKYENVSVWLIEEIE